MEIVAVRRDDQPYPPQQFEDIALAAAQFDRRNAIAALCDGAIGAVRLAGKVRPEHVRVAKEEIVAAWNLDAHGIKDLRRYLRRATSTPLGTE